MECIVRDDVALIYEKYNRKDQEILSQIKEKRKRAEESREFVNSRMDPHGQLKLTEL